MRETLLYYTILSIISNKIKNAFTLIPTAILLFLIFSSILLVDSIKSLSSHLSSKGSKIYGRYYTSPKGDYFLLIGSKDTPKGEMVISKNISKWLKEHYYQDSFNFISLNSGDLIKLKIKNTLPKSANLIASDVIILNPTDLQNILGPLSYSKLNRVDKIFNQEGGFFIVIYVVVVIGFLMIFYLKYNQIRAFETKEIKILRAIGWSKRDIFKFKLYENLIQTIFIVSLSFFLAYIYIFKFDAPLLNYIFTGGVEGISYTPSIDTLKIGVIFATFTLFYLLITLFAIKRGEREPLLV